MADLKIYTRTGDRGTTAIHGKMRVSKTDMRIEANGTLDELNVSIGIVRSFMDEHSAWQPELKAIQITLMTVMSRVATVNDRRNENPNPLPCNMVEHIEPSAVYGSLMNLTPLSLRYFNGLTDSVISFSLWLGMSFSKPI